MSVEPEDKKCPRCGSSAIDWADYEIIDTIDEFDDVEVCAAVFWMVCWSCGFEWESDGIVIQSRKE